MADVTGARGTANILADQKEIDMAETVMELEPSAAPLAVFSSKMNKKRAINPVINWLEDDLFPRLDLADGAVTNVATTMSVDNGSYFAVGDLVFVPRTGEVVRFTGITADVIDTMDRGVGATSGTAMNDNEELIIIGTTFEEGASAPATRSRNPVKVTNYTQIQKRPFEMTATLRSTAMVHTPHDWPRHANKAGIEHTVDLEEMFLFGTPEELTSGSHPERACGGFYNYATQNKTDAGGVFSEDAFFAAKRPAFRYGSKTKLGMASGLVVDVLNGYPRSSFQTNVQDKIFGVNVMRYFSPHGTLNVVRHDLFEGADLGGKMAIVDMEQVKYRPLNGEGGSRDTKIETNIQLPDADLRKDQYITEVALEFGLPLTHASFFGITS